jgi:hypothetical protein
MVAGAAAAADPRPQHCRKGREAASRAAHETHSIDVKNAARQQHGKKGKPQLLHQW